jgi:hypothetical protein
MDVVNFMISCRNLSGRGLVGELVKDYYVYESMSELKRLDLSHNKLGYGVAPIPNGLAKLKNLEYLCAPASFFHCFFWRNSFRQYSCVDTFSSTSIRA